MRGVADADAAGAPVSVASRRLAVTGKGGSGKSVIAGTLARVIARRGHRVLVLDSDPLPGLTFSLGADVPDEPPLNGAAFQSEDRRWHLVKGVGPARAVQRFATVAPDGVRVLQIGKVDKGGIGPNRASHNAFYQLAHRIERRQSLKDWVILGDLPAGGRQMAFDWAPYARHFLLVVEPTWQGMLTARRIIKITRAMSEKDKREGVTWSLIVNKVTPESDVQRAEDFLGVPLLGTVPADEDVRMAEREGVALLDLAPDGPAVDAIEQLADRLRVGSIES